MMCTIERTKKLRPITDPMADPIIPSLYTFWLMVARNTLSTSLLLSKFMAASFRPWVTSEEKRKKLKETT
ncbi:hypothetical protein SLE2022_209620 [Rubroshorea leprosula]